MKETPDFLSIWDYLYERSLGCVGILKNWTRNALADALEEEALTVTHKHLESRALSGSQALNILRKIKEGEKKYADMEAEIELLRTELDLGIEPQSRSESVKKNTTQKIKRKKTNVGLRNPKRDPTRGKKNAQ